MNLLAKHFFDYQSFINLPHKAVQLHKTPPSQAGVDPSASWAPKSMHLAEKNQPAPAARANRHHIEPRVGHRHGRPSKLEFRKWGDRHGEPHEEKIIPHKDPWMATLQGGFRHFYEYEEAFDTDGVDSAIQHFPTFSQRCVEVNDMEVLAILTLTSRKDLITLTVKAIRNAKFIKSRPLIRVQVFEGGNLVEERFGTTGTDFDENIKAKLEAQRHIRPPISSSNRITSSKTSPNIANNNRRISRGYGKIMESQMHPNIQIFRQPNSLNNSETQSPANVYKKTMKQKSNNVRVVYHNGGPVTRFSNPTLNRYTPTETQMMLQRNRRMHRGHSLTLESNYAQRNFQRQFSKRLPSPPLSDSHIQEISATSALNDISNLDERNEEALTEIGNCFMFRTSSSRLQRCHILVQVYASIRSVAPPPPPESAPNFNDSLENATNEIVGVTKNKCCIHSESENNSRKVSYFNETIAVNNTTKYINGQHPILVENLSLKKKSSDGSIKNSSNCNSHFQKDYDVAIRQNTDEVDYCMETDYCIYSNEDNLVKTESVGQQSLEDILPIKNSSNVDVCQRAENHAQQSISTRRCSSLNDPLPDDSSVSEYNTPSRDYSQELERLSEQLNRLDSNDSANDSILSELTDAGAEICSHCSECRAEEFSSDVSSSISWAENLNVNHEESNASSGESSGVSCDGTVKNVLIGGFVIGPLGSSRGRWHWRQMIQRNSFPVCMWHRLIRSAIPLKQRTRKPTTILIPADPSFQTKVPQTLGNNMRRCLTFDAPTKNNIHNTFSLSSPASIISAQPSGTN